MDGNVARSFLQSDACIPGSDGELHEQTKYFGFNKMGHYDNVCTEVSEEV